MKRIGVLVVAYNAEGTLVDVLQRIPDEVVEKVEEIFVFDDFSADRTYEVGLGHRDSSMAAKLVMRRNPTNLQYGGNQKVGYQYALERGLDIVVLLHGDGQYAPEVMQRLLDPLERDGADMVMGSRMLEHGAARRGNMPLYKYVGNKILTFTQNALLGQHLSEYHSGYRAFSCAALATVDFARMTDTWHFDTQMILNFLKQGYRIGEVPIPTYYGDEISRVNGITYALHCVRVTAVHALTERWSALRALRPTSRSAK
jgi:glycosyltransferase involved in cell wall biosynthesis